MRLDYVIILTFGMLLISRADIQAQIPEKINREGLIAYWDFSDKEDIGKSKGKFKGSLTTCGHPVTVLDDGPLSGKSILFDGKSYLTLPYSQTGELDILNNQVTILAWVKWTGEQTGFICGMWNEHENGGKRQYGLFVSLPHYNGHDQVCGHISKSGKPTPPFPYSIDYSASKQKVPHNTNGVA